MRQSIKTFALASGVTASLLVIGLMPGISIGGIRLRKVDLLSDIRPAAPSARIAGDTLLAATTSHAAEWPDSIVPIEDFSQGNPGGMTHFYDMMANIHSLGRPVRIAVLGDSFFGADITTCTLREHMQDEYGGEGVGWIDFACAQDERRATVTHLSEGAQEHIPHQKGYDWQHALPTLRYCQVGKGAWATFDGTRYKRHLKGWSRASLFCGKAVSLSASQADDTMTSMQTEETENLKRCTMRVAGGKLHIKARGSGVVYGVALESAEGVIVDNFGVPGMSGKEISKVPAGLAREFASLRSYDLIMLEYGLNVASDENLAYHYENYLRQMRKTVARLRETWPDASILVMGVPDRAGNTDTGLGTMPCIIQMEATLHQLAQEEQVGFYSLLDAMGGTGSMVEYVKRKLANKDYTHLTYEGGDVLGKAIYESITTGCHLYGQNNSHNSK